MPFQLKEVTGKMLKNMVAVVTGAVNGLGRQTLTHFCNENAKVFGCDIRDDDGEIERSFPGNVGFMKADVRDEKLLEEVFQRAKDKFGRVDILVNCAGFAASFPLVSMKGDLFETESFSRLLDINVTGQFLASHLAAKVMAENEPDKDGNRGVIILTSGFAARTPRTGQVGLSACYEAVESMTLPMSRDFGSLGIRVATISPGLFNTPLTASIPPEVTRFLVRCQSFPYRFGEPQEYSDLALHIVQNKLLNGDVLSIDGGLVLPVH